ncbi:type cbb3 cytochrome oxidase biogenesis protein CcoI [alpha proteobacterium U9-1i]|nr:type cbb3 cytochrome oxidase biogenesis protein CcoI [alpha proteobacterium U9-1i]
MADTLAAGCPSGLSAPTEDEALPANLAVFVRKGAHGDDVLELMVDGASCAQCIKKIEGGLLALPGVADARLNLSTKRLRVAWRPGALAPDSIAATLARLGYAAAPFDPELAQQNVDEEGRFLLRCLAVAGFGAMNIMMFTTPVWFGDDMGADTRTLMHWFGALVAVPCGLYAAQPFFRSAWKALRAGHANMDVPISLAVMLTFAMSIAETAMGGAHTYFDGVTMLLFFLLIGRYLDHRLREKARSAAREILALQAVSARRIGVDGAVEAVASRDIAIGDRLLLAVGERAPCDGVIVEGASDLDCSMLTGETLPTPVRAGDAILAGAINASRPITMRAEARAEDSAVAELARLIEVGEQGRGRFVRLADRAAALYVPLVHGVALLTLIGWLVGPLAFRALGFDVAEPSLRVALANAVAVLIITCPCALGLAVPAVQVVATGRLFNAGVLVRSGDALERLAKVDTVVFDKTGTLTLGKPKLITSPDEQTLLVAASLARVSRHPLSRALVEAAGPGAAVPGATEIPGEGVEALIEGRSVRLGKRTFAAPGEADANDGSPELWFTAGDGKPVRFVFADALRPDAAEAVAALMARGLQIEMLSGDRPSAAEAAARAAGIADWRSSVTPAQKTARMQALRALGRKPLMVGDGLNDAAALAAAHASASPGHALQASQAAADLVLQGDALMGLVEAIDVAKRAERRAGENLAFSALYNVIAAPLAAAGFLTPLIAAVAMSSSSLIVTLNALRMQGKR